MAVGIESSLGGIAPLPRIPPPAPVSGITPIDASLEDDPQRNASTFERFLNFLGTPNHIVAGAVDALTRGEDPLKGAALGIHQNTTFGSILQKQGMSGPVAGVLGLGLDIALDPLSYLGVGELTAAGKAIKGVHTAETLARLAAAKAGEAIPEALAPTLAATAAARAAAGEQSILSLAGKAIVPQKFSEAVFKATEPMLKWAAQTEVGQGLNKALRAASRNIPEPLQAVLGQSRGTTAVAYREALEKYILPAHEEVRAMAKSGAIPLDVANGILADAIESRVQPGAVFLLRELRPQDAAEAQRLFDLANLRQQATGGPKLERSLFTAGTEIPGSGQVVAGVAGGHVLPLPEIMNVLHPDDEPLNPTYSLYFISPPPVKP